MFRHGGARRQKVCDPTLGDVCVRAIFDSNASGQLSFLGREELVLSLLQLSSPQSQKFCASFIISSVLLQTLVFFLEFVVMRWCMTSL